MDERKKELANEKRRAWAKKLHKLAHKYQDEGYDYKEAQRLANRDLKKLKPQKSSKCKGVEPNDDDECEEPCPIKSVSKSGKSYCKSKPSQQSAPSRRISNKSLALSKKSVLDKPLDNLFYIPGDLVITSANKAVLITQNKVPLEFTRKNGKLYLYDANNESIEIQPLSAVYQVNETEAEFLQKHFDIIDLKDIIEDVISDNTKLKRKFSKISKNKKTYIKFIVDNFYNDPELELPYYKAVVKKQKENDSSLEEEEKEEEEDEEQRKKEKKKRDNKAYRERQKRGERKYNIEEEGEEIGSI